MVVMFRAFDQGFLGGTTVALLCALLLNGMTFCFFLMTVWMRRCPSVLETWHAFFAQSEARHRAATLSAGSGARIAHASRSNSPPRSTRTSNRASRRRRPSGQPARNWIWARYAVLILAAIPDYFIQYWFNASLDLHTVFFTNLRMQLAAVRCVMAGWSSRRVYVPISLYAASPASGGRRSTVALWFGTLRRLARRPPLPGLPAGRFTACRLGRRIRSSVTTSASTCTGCRSCRLTIAGADLGARGQPSCATVVARFDAMQQQRAVRAPGRHALGEGLAVLSAVHALALGRGRHGRRGVPVPAALQPAVQGQRGMRAFASARSMST